MAKEQDAKFEGRVDLAELERLRSETMRRISEAGIDLDKSGAVLYNGWSTLSERTLYVMGLNPGGDEKDHLDNTIRKSLIERCWQYSAYEAECWGSFCRGKSPHQMRVKRLCAMFGCSPVDVFAANAIFVRTCNSRRIDPSLWAKCWPIHQWFLSVVKPKVVLCLGNGEGLSPFSLLRQACENPDFVKIDGGFRNGRWFRARVPAVGGADTVVVGVPHPSRFPISPRLEEFCTNLSGEASLNSGYVSGPSNDISKGFDLR